MFAYCGNNPVNCLDPSGYVPHSQFVNTYFDGNYTLPYIIDQEGDDVGNKRFGVTTVSHGGCGIIASYNALVSLGNSRSIDEVLAYYNSRIGLTVGLGLMGLLPHEIESYFSSMGYSVVTTNQQSQIDLLSETADVCIMYYEFPQTYQLFGVIPLDAYGAHFVEYSRIRDGYLGRNTSEGSNTYAFTSPYNYGTKGSRYYVVGIFIYK